MKHKKKKSQLWGIELKRDHIVVHSKPFDPAKQYLGRDCYNFRALTAKAAVRRFIRGTLSTLCVLRDDGDNDIADAKGGQKHGHYFVEKGEAKKYSKTCVKIQMSKVDTGGTYGIKVVYR